MEATKLAERQERFTKIDTKLKELFPDAKIALNYSNPWELLVAVVLSAQSTDVGVNRCTDKLFPKYPSFEDYLNVTIPEFEKDVSSINFYHNKAKNILATAKIVHEKFGNQVPKTMAELITLPGVARKTANIVQGNAYQVYEGIAVDTHVKRFAQKLDLSDFSDPEKIEKDLMQVVPKAEWFPWTYRIIDYGRKICTARKHDCAAHPLSVIYPPAALIFP